jgi:hypothetical protein
MDHREVGQGAPASQLHPFSHFGETFGAIPLGRHIYNLALRTFDPQNFGPISQIVIKLTPEASQPPIVFQPDPALLYPNSGIIQFYSHVAFLLIQKLRKPVLPSNEIFSLPIFQITSWARLSFIG